MISVEGEMVPLKTRIKPAEANGAVEKWLVQVGEMSMMRGYACVAWHGACPWGLLLQKSAGPTYSWEHSTYVGGCDQSLLALEATTVAQKFKNA
jgi:hypothetical protein